MTSPDPARTMRFGVGAAVAGYLVGVPPHMVGLFLAALVVGAALAELVARRRRREAAERAYFAARRAALAAGRDPDAESAPLLPAWMTDHYVTPPGPDAAQALTLSGGGVVRAGEPWPGPGVTLRPEWPPPRPIDVGLPPLVGAEDDLPTPPPWRRPTDAHSAYPRHRKATFGGGVYESLIDGNIWTPDTPAWRLVAYLPDLHPVPTRIRYGPTPAHVED